MDRFNRLQRIIASLLVLAVMMPAASYAGPKNKAPLTIQDQVVKLGVGRWVCVDEKNGLALVGRITGIGDQSFGIQLHNYPEITDVAYAEVVRVRGAGVTAKGVLIITGVFVGAAVATGLIMHHEYEANKPTLPPSPANPVFP